MEIIASDDRLRQLHTAGQGFIFNDFEGDHHTGSSMEFNKLHRASCDECSRLKTGNTMTVRTSGQKIWFATMADAAGWLMEHRPGNYTRCTRCNPA